MLVGPNNVGKSQTLGDILGKIVSGPTAPGTLVGSVQVERSTTFDELIRGVGIEVLPSPSNVRTQIIRGINFGLLGADQLEIDTESYKTNFRDGSDLSFLLGSLGRLHVSYLDAASRLAVSQQTPSHNPHESAPQSLLQALFASGGDAEAQLRAAFRGTFGMDIRLDYSAMQALLLRVASEFEEIPADPREAYPVMKKHHPLDTQGDGFRSFVGVALSVILSRDRVILLDEPEAFLHPAQARRLGYWLAQQVEEGAGQIIVATHNANFLAGILARSETVELYRLNRVENHTTFNRISAESVNQLARSALLSSQRVLEAIFYKGVVVCEADSDRAVYELVATREHDNRNLFFVHAHNKQAIKTVVQLMRHAAIPVCAIADIDILDSEEELAELLSALNPEGDHSELLSKRDALAAFVNGRPETQLLTELTTGVQLLVSQLERGEHNLAGARGALNRINRSVSKWSAVKRRGVEGLEEGQKANAREVISSARKSGLFIVPVGELEGWLDLQVAQKNKWIVAALEAIGRGECSGPLRGFVAMVLRHMGEESPAPGAPT